VVHLRARGACEYCLLPIVGAFNVDHIIPPGKWTDYVKGRLTGVPPQPGRRGPDHLDNYACACPHCNNQKGEEVARRDVSGLVRLFDPRYDHWPDYFVFEESRYLFVVGVPPEGRATQLQLGFNNGEPDGPLGPRHVAIVERRYPPPWARKAYGV